MRVHSPCGQPGRLRDENKFGTAPVPVRYHSQWHMVLAPAHRTCLRAFVTHLLDELDLDTDFQSVKTGLRHAVAVKIDVPPVWGLDETVALRGEHLNHAANVWHVVCLHVPTLAPRMVFQLARRRIEGIGNRDVDILVLP